MKAAILGTTDYHTTMQQIAQNALQRMGGYKPQKVDKHFELPSITENCVSFVDILVQKISEGDASNVCNKRFPYLLIAWLLIGSDSPYPICKSAIARTIQRQVAILHISIALGIVPLIDEVHELADTAYSVAGKETLQAVDDTYETIEVAAFAADVALYALNNHFKPALDTFLGIFYQNDVSISSQLGTVKHNTVWEYVYHKLKEWAYLTDEEALHIARQLLFDILDAGK